MLVLRFNQLDKVRTALGGTPQINHAFRFGKQSRIYTTYLYTPPPS